MSGLTGRAVYGAVGKTLVKELSYDIAGDVIGSSAGSFIFDLTGNSSLSRLTGLSAGMMMTSNPNKVKGLNSVDGASSSAVKGLNHADNFTSTSKKFDRFASESNSDDLRNASKALNNAGDVSRNTLSNAPTIFDIDTIRPKLKTEPDTAFFWSGRTDGIGGANIAADIAKSKGGVTLESTIESKNITMPEWDFNNPSSMEAWNMASGVYAEQVSGEVRAVIGSNLRDGNIWENVELPRLKNNPDITKITTIDPKTGVKTIIFER